MSSSDFPITADSHLSRRHLLIDSTKQSFRVRDLGSSNGTFLNDNRIDVESLKQGDLIRAGSCVFEVSFVKSGENPHESDGTLFGKTISSFPREPSEAQRTINFDSLPASKTTSPEQAEAKKLLDFESTVLVNAASKSNQPNENIQPNQTLIEHSWLENFEPEASQGIFRLSRDYVSTRGRFFGILELLGNNQAVSLIVNTSQIASIEPSLKELQKSGHKVEPIANSLALVHGKSASEFEEFLVKQTARDAFICLIHENPLVAADLREFANSFSFPSLFARHILHPEYPCHSYLALNGIAALYETDKQGQISYFHPQSLVASNKERSSR